PPAGSAVECRIGPDSVVTALPAGGDEAESVAIPSGTAEAAREESSAIQRLLVVTSLLLLLIGWLLPWFLEPTGGGIGVSAQDVVSRAPASPLTALVYLIAVAFLMLIGGFARNLLRGRRIARRDPSTMLLLAASLIGAVGTALLWLLIVVAGVTSPFGPTTANTFTNSAVWMTVAGFSISAFAYGAPSFIRAHGNLAFALVAFGLGGLFPVVFGHANDFIAWGASSAGIYTLLALGLNVVVGFAGLLDLGYAAFFAIGAYTCASLASSDHNLHIPFWVLIFLGAAVAALFGALLGAPTLRLRGDYLAIVTLGFGEIVPDMAQNNIFGLTGGPNGISGIDSPAFPAHGHALLDFGLLGVNPSPYFYALLLLIALVIVALRNTEHSRLGRAWVAIREDEIAAASMGVNPISTKLLAFSMGASVSGFAGAFFGAMYGSVSPDTFQFAVSITALSTVVLGGIGNIAGVTVGAFMVSFVIFWVLPNLQKWMGTVGGTVHLPVLATIDYSRFKFIIYGLVLIGIMLLRPAGLLPTRARKVELTAGVESGSLAAVQGRA
ncbi:MAG: hypothetical protein JOY80_03620, partial [Candidatus Dormibacteraeota bacterium]|nr:hypothetical protein [Candidatus Dormibacteraeota bacterium]